MTTWLVTDLDDTWVKTARKIADTTNCLNVIPENSTFEPTYLHPASSELWLLFQKMQVPLLPVTGRSWLSASSWRIQGNMPWVYGGIFSHGACIKDLKGQTDLVWKAFLQETLQCSEQQEALEIWHQTVLKSNWHHSADQRIAGLQTEDNEPLGWVVKAKSKQAEHYLKALEPIWTEQAISLGLHVFHQKNHITVMPKGLSKASALLYWKETYPDANDRFIGFGDALQDLEFMNLCDWWMTPAKSDISTFLTIKTT